MSVTAVVAVEIGVRATYPRDEPGFLAYVHRYGNYDGRALEDPPPDSVLLEAGDRACGWLGDRSPALWRTDDAHTINRLITRHEAVLASDDPDLPRTVTAGAWEYLCPATKELVRPHRLFGADDPA